MKVQQAKMAEQKKKKKTKHRSKITKSYQTASDEMNGKQPINFSIYLNIVTHGSNWNAIGLNS